MYPRTGKVSVRHMIFAACEGMSGQGILKLEEDITKALIKDWKKYDVYGAVKC